MLAYPDVQVLDVTGPLEVFGRAARWIRDHGLSRELVYHVEIVAPRAGAFRSSSGLRLVAERAYRSVRSADTLLVAGGVGYAAAKADGKLLKWLCAMSGKVARLGSICNGALILAASGLLQGRRATTHWAFLRELQTSLGGGVCDDAIYIRDGKFYTSAGVTAGMDMALAMLEEDWGTPVALAVARELVLFLKRPGGQSQFSDHLAAQFSEDSALRDLQLWMLSHLEQDLSVARLAERASMSQRNFARHFASSVGVTPGHYVRQIRLNAARRKLEQTSAAHDSDRAALRIRNGREPAAQFCRRSGRVSGGLPGTFSGRLARAHRSRRASDQWGSFHQASSATAAGIANTRSSTGVSSLTA